MSAAIPDNVWIDAAQLTALRARNAAFEREIQAYGDIMNEVQRKCDALRARNEKLREALEKIEDYWSTPAAQGVAEMARAALAGEE